MSKFLSPEKLEQLSSESTSFFKKYISDEKPQVDMLSPLFDTPNTIPPTFQEDIFKMLNAENEKKKEVEKFKAINSSLKSKMMIMKERYKKRIQTLKMKHKMEIMKLKVENDRIRRDLKLQKSGTKYATRKMDYYRAKSTESTPRETPTTPEKKRSSTNSTPSSRPSSMKDLILGLRSQSMQVEPSPNTGCVCCYVTGEEEKCSSSKPKSPHTLKCERMMDLYTIEIQKAKIDLLEEKLSFQEEKFARSQLEFVKNVGLIDFYL